MNNVEMVEVDGNVGWRNWEGIQFINKHNLLHGLHQIQQCQLKMVEGGIIKIAVIYWQTTTSLRIYCCEESWESFKRDPCEIM